MTCSDALWIYSVTSLLLLLLLLLLPFFRITVHSFRRRVCEESTGQHLTGLRTPRRYGPGRGAAPRRAKSIFPLMYFRVYFHSKP